MTASTPRTRAAPARPPAGFPIGYRSYLSYLIFGASSVSMLIGCVALLFALRALDQGEEAWRSYLAALASPGALLATALISLHTLFFAIRFGWMARKIAAGKVKGVPLAPPLPLSLLGVVPISAFASTWLLVLLLLGGGLP
jgi:fumarate reductase subunit C